MFFLITLFSCNALKCVSINNKEWKARPIIMNVNSDEPSFYAYSIFVSKYSSSTNINDPYAKLCVPHVGKDINIELFNPISRINETRYVFQHEICTCKCVLDASVCNNKQCWNNDKCRCECKELIDKGKRNDGFIWNLGISECKCGKSYDVGQYLDYVTCTCRKRLIDKLVEEFIEDINGNEMIHNVVLNDHKKYAILVQCNIQYTYIQYTYYQL